MILSLRPQSDSLDAETLAGMQAMGVNPETLETNDDLLAVTIFLRALTDLGTLKYMDTILGRNPEHALKEKEYQLKREVAQVDKDTNTGVLSALVEAVHALADDGDGADTNAADA
jgi:hypothetical protein